MVGCPKAPAGKLLAISVALVTVMGVQGSALAHRFQSTAARHQQSGAITGKVFADGLPAGYVRLSVVGMGQTSGGMALTDLMTRVNQEQTEEDGSFSLEGLAPGAYSIDISAPGYIVESGLQDEDGKRIYYRPGDTVTIRMIKGGVITGKVTDSAGQPLVKAPVHPTRLRDEKGRPPHDAGGMRSLVRDPAETDDRGIYRLYGLEPGTYIVSAGGGTGGPFSESTPLDGDGPVYHPSGTADVAAEVKVMAGQERAGVDISYSPIPGHSVSGHMGGQFVTGGFVSVGGVLLTNSRTGVPQAQTVTLPGADSHAFVMRGVPDGEYSLTAMSFSVGKELTLAAPRHITVKGSDVTGIELVLAPMTAIAGKVVIEPPKQDEKSGCKPGATRLEEIVVSPHPAEKSKTTEAAASPDLFGSFTGDSTPDGKGDFAVQVLGGGSYHLETGLKDEDLFLNSVTLPPEGADKTPKDANAGISVKTGQRVNGATVTISHGAARVAGKVAVTGSTLPDRLRAYLVPMEKEAADNTLRYYDSLVRRDGSFEIKHIAPGRYYVAVHALTQDEWDEVNPRPIWWGSGPRRRLRQQAEAENTTLELKACQQVKDHAVRYAAAAAAPAAQPAKTP